MKILVTGAAGFVGYHVCEILLQHNFTVVGLDNINDYYDVNLKYGRLEQLGINKKDAEKFHLETRGNKHGSKFSFIRMNLEDREELPKLFASAKFDLVCNLAAQAGVRYSLEEPNIYVDSNVVGFLNILECCRHNSIKHLVYASSSSVYGNNKKIPFSVEDNVDHPISLYAATKKSNELMAHTYSHLFKIPTTGLRFFTVYGPWGRPDMAPFLFTDAISKNKAIKVFNHGNMERDFTYITDITEGIFRVLKQDLTQRKESNEFYKLYNIGNNSSVKLLYFIEQIELNLKTSAKKLMMDIQPGDVEKTWADIESFVNDYEYKPKTSIELGVKNYINWYQDFYKIK
ncbi:NAD-dependent epimerase [Maribacter sp. 2308TA10-17]|uniref:NAD-dependent epimerase n=1 Tax=Maribacter sp. 2308TA10-17 TaxID=3386276 RepID=UPI0039BD513C